MYFDYNTPSCWIWLILAFLVYGLISRLSRLWAAHARTRLLADTLKEAMVRGATPPPELLEAIKADTSRWHRHHHRQEEAGAPDNFGRHRHCHSPYRRVLILGAFAVAFGAAALLHHNPGAAQGFEIAAIMFGCLTVAFALELLLMRRMQP
jgi:hypothetical protein